MTEPGLTTAENHAGLVGTTLDGKYRIEALVGSGGMGSVYRAHSLPFDKPVAIKLINQGAANESSPVFKRFMRESSALEKLSHPNIVRFYAFGVAEGRPFTVMEYVQGTTLSDLLESRGTLPITECLPIFRQLLSAVEAAHQAGIMHRDLKPSNIMLVLDGNGQAQVKILDFGLAKLIAEEPDGQRVTKTGAVMGSPLYMSPEQCLGAGVGPASDLYALGCVFYECLTGKPPFNGDNSYAILIEHVNSSPPLTPQIESLLQPLGPVILKALSKEPSDRFGSAAIFQETLDAAVAGELKPEQLVVSAGRSARNTRRAPGGKLAILLVALLATLGMALSWISQPRDISDPIELSKRAVVSCENRQYQAAIADLGRALQDSTGPNKRRVFDSLKECLHRVSNRYTRLMVEAENQWESKEPISAHPAFIWLVDTYVKIGPSLNEDELRLMDICRLSAKRAAVPEVMYHQQKFGGDMERAEKYLLLGIELAERHAEDIAQDEWTSLSNIARNTTTLFRKEIDKCTSPSRIENLRRRRAHVVKMIETLDARAAAAPKVQPQAGRKKVVDGL